MITFIHPKKKGKKLKAVIEIWVLLRVRGQLDYKRKRSLKLGDWGTVSGTSLFFSATGL